MKVGTINMAQGKAYGCTDSKTDKKTGYHPVCEAFACPTYKNSKNSPIY